jgi:hypothetical protein
MHTCPHCHAPGVRNLALRWSSRDLPAKCRACGRLCHVIGSTSSGIFTMCLVLLCLAAFAGLALASWWAFLAGLAVIVAYNVWAWRRAELFPISEASAQAAGRVSWVILAVGVLARLFTS